LPVRSSARGSLCHRKRPGGFNASAGFASNGYGALSPGKYSMGAAIITEVAMTFMFLIVILGATHHRAPVGFAGLAIGLALTLIHLISIPVTNTSVNPARSTARLSSPGWRMSSSFGCSGLLRWLERRLAASSTEGCSRVSPSLRSLAERRKHK
jgi:hypothetical protein